MNRLYNNFSEFCKIFESENILPNTTSKVEDIKSLSSKNYDSKNITNKANDVSFNNDIIEKIENDGITYEDLIDLEKKVPIYKYKTQITIHGIFPTSTISRIGGYKNVIINKNGSLGLKYNAIDYKKKMDLARLLKAMGISYHRSSTDNYYYKSSYSLEDVKNIYDRIDTDLFIGDKHLQRFNYYGKIVYILIININTFPIGNFDKIAENITNKTISELNSIVLDKEESLKRKNDELRNKFKEEEEQFNKEYDNITSKLGLFKLNSSDIKEGDIIYTLHKVYKSIYYRVFIYKGKNRGFYKFSYNENMDKEVDHKDINFDSYMIKNINDRDLDKMMSYFRNTYRVIRGGVDITDSIKNNNKINNEPIKIEDKSIDNSKRSVSDIELVEYSDKAIALFGDTYKYKNELKNIGKYNSYLKRNGTIQAGWIFSKSKESEVRKIINLK